MLIGAVMDNSFLETLFGLSKPKTLEKIAQSFQHDPEYFQIVEKIINSGIFQDDKLKRGEMGADDPIPISNLYEFILELAETIKFSPESIDREKKIIEEKFEKLMTTYIDTIKVSFSVQCCLVKPDKHINFVKKIFRISNGIEKLKDDAIKKISHVGRRPDLVYQIINIFQTHAPDAAGTTLSFRISELLSKFGHHHEPDAIRKKIERQTAKRQTK